MHGDWINPCSHGAQAQATILLYAILYGTTGSLGWNHLAGIHSAWHGGNDYTTRLLTRLDEFMHRSEQDWFTSLRQCCVLSTSCSNRGACIFLQFQEATRHVAMKLVRTGTLVCCHGPQMSGNARDSSSLCKTRARLYPDVQSRWLCHICRLPLHIFVFHGHAVQWQIHMLVRVVLAWQM